MNDNARRDIPATLSIHTYCHCSKCLQEIQDGKAGRISPRDYARLNIGMTDLGFQIWCVRHECNVVHIDFQGQQHPANMGIDLKPVG